MFIKGKRYTEKFKIEAIKQATDRGYLVAEVAVRRGTTPHHTTPHHSTAHSLYARLKKYKEPSPRHADILGVSAENAKLKADLRRMTEERDIPKKVAA